MDLKFVTVETFLIQTVILFLIIYVLNRFLFKPYLAYLDKLEEKQKKIEEDYKNMDSLLVKAEKDREKILSEAREKWAKIISESENIWNKKRETIILKAEDDAKKLLEWTRWEIEKERNFMVSSIKSSVVNLVLRLNSKLFKKENITEEFVKKELETAKI